MAQQRGTGEANSWTTGERKTADLDQTTTEAPTITQETVKPSRHEIIDEQIEREYHTHEVFPQIQPIYQKEVLPARHYVQDQQGKLTEVAEKDVPLYMGPKKGSPEQEETAESTLAASTTAKMPAERGVHTYESHEGGKRSIKQRIRDHVHRH